MKPGGGFLGKSNIEVDAKRLGVLIKTAATNAGSVVTIGGSEWEYAGNITIDANSATDTVVYVLNDGGGEADLNVEGDIVVGGTVDGIDVSSLGGAQYVLMTTDAGLPNERVLTAGDGLDLTDGGAGSTVTLAVDVTDFIDTSYGLTESSNNIRVNLAATSGLNFSAGALLVGAGDGIDVLTNTIAVDVTDILGSGLTESSNNIDLNWGTPTIGTIEPDDAASAGTSTNPARSDHQHAIVAAAPTVNLSVSSTNAEGATTSFARNSHTHAITSSSNPGAAASILASDANGRLQLTGLGINVAPTTTELRVDANLVFVGTQYIQTSADHLYLQPTGDLYIDPTGNNALVTSSVELSTDNWVSGLNGTGWGIQYDGSADFRYLFTEELRTYAFTAEIYSALAGALIITKSRARVSRDFTIPNTGVGATLYVEDLEGWAEAQVFTANDYVLLRVVDTSGGGLLITDVYGQVTGYTNLSGGEQSWTFTTTTTGYSSADVIYRGSVALDYGQTGSGSTGVWMATVLDTAGAPYSQVQTWDTITAGEPDNFTTHVRLGNLDGISGIGLEYGLWAGQGTTTTDPYIIVSDSSAVLHNLDFEIHDGSNTVIKMDYSTPYLGIGATAPSSYLGGDGFWVGNDSGTYKLHLGDVNAGALVAGLSWDGSALQILGDLVVGPGLGFAIDDALLYCPFDGPRPFETDYQVNVRGHMGQVPAASGSVIGRPGIYGKGAQIAGGTTNLIINPSFEINTTSWATGGTNTIAQSADQSLYGTYSALCTYQDSTSLAYYSITLTAAQHFGSAWVYVPPDWDGGDIYIDWVGYTAASETEHYRWTAVSDPTGVWHRLIREITPDAGDLIGTFRILTGSAPTAGRYIYLDATQIEAKAYPTPYCDGSLGDGHVWDTPASPHASTSTRTAAELDFDDYINGLITRQGSVCGWLQTGPAVPSDMAINVYLFDVRGADNNNRIAVQWSTDDLFDLYVNGAYRVTNIGSGSVSPADEIFWCATWDFDADSYALYVYEVSGGDSGTDTTALTFPAVTALNFGSQYNGTNQVNGIIDDCLILPRVLSSDEVRAIYESGAPLQVSTNKFELMLTDQGAGKVIGAATGLFGYDDTGDEVFALVTTDSTTWGGLTVDSGDVVLGDPDGAHMLWDKSAGQMLFRDSTPTTQVYVDTDGKLYAGTGAVHLDSDGVTIEATTAWADDTAYKWYDGSDNTVGWISHYANTGSGESHMAIYADASFSGYDDSLVQIGAGGGSSDNQIVLNVNSGDAILTLSGPNNAAWIWGSSAVDLEISGGLFVGGFGGMNPDSACIMFAERTSEPTKPSEGEAVLWMTNGTGIGDDGDVIIGVTAGGSSKYTIVHDHSAATTWS